MADDELILAELLCARLIHDLSGPVGAVANGAELLGDEESDAAMAGEAIALLSTSAAAAIARLRFLRLALGPAGGPPPPADLRRIANDYFTKGATGGEAIALVWPPTLDAGLAGVPGRLILNLLMLARDCLPRGGAVRVEPPVGGAALTVAADGPGAAPADATKALAAPSAAGLNARGVSGYLTARLAALAGLRVTAAATAGKVTLTLAKV